VLVYRNRYTHLATRARLTRSLSGIYGLISNTGVLLIASSPFTLRRVPRCFSKRQIVMAMGLGR